MTDFLEICWPHLLALGGIVIYAIGHLLVCYFQEMREREEIARVIYNRLPAGSQFKTPGQIRIAALRRSRTP